MSTATLSCGPFNARRAGSCISSCHSAVLTRVNRSSLLLSSRDKALSMTLRLGWQEEASIAAMAIYLCQFIAYSFK